MKKIKINFERRHADITGRTFLHHTRFYIFFNVKNTKTFQEIERQFLLFCKRNNILLKKIEAILVDQSSVCPAYDSEQCFNADCEKCKEKRKKYCFIKK